MENTLQQGIAAAKGGNKDQAFHLLSEATQDASTAERAWLWLSSVVEHDSERLFCLDNVLRTNPENEAAQRGATVLRKNGIFPAPPSQPVPTVPEQEFSEPVRSEASPTPQQPESEVVARPETPAASMTSPEPAVSAPASQISKEDIQAMYQFVAGELTRNTSPQLIEQELVKRSVPPDLAKQLIGSTQAALKKNRGEKHRKRMIRGALWTLAGLIITCGSYFLASDLGGSYVLCWGAIIFGIIDFLIGLFGWLTNR